MSTSPSTYQLSVYQDQSAMPNPLSATTYAAFLFDVAYGLPAVSKLPIRQ
ncbi:hypothetical protein SAMN02745130_03838 [Thiothrix eikelboomii]|uniref:Uncharacterized protein n=1 Tax=Thiothrix eikelboomii TaxID=92487 RepID=A0A1T4Y2N6_9GAMM|nr:hypothetical protein SAMN02745130_03838 [Thiothrix eikelboomii]